MGSDSGSTPRIYLAIEIIEPMPVVHQPTSAAWPQASPRLAPWVLNVPIEQSLCECFGASAPMISSPLPLCR